MTSKDKPPREVLFTVDIGDLEVQTFRSGGPGGQNQNKRDTGVRLIHHPSGARGESREERSQWQNKHKALVKLAKSPLFKFWVALESRRLNGYRSAEEWVDAQLADLKNIKVEYKDAEGRWVDWNDEEPGT